MMEQTEVRTCMCNILCFYCLGCVGSHSGNYLVSVGRPLVRIQCPATLWSGWFNRGSG